MKKGKPYRFNLSVITYQIDSDGTVWKIGYRDSLHMMTGPDADFILRHGRALQWIEQTAHNADYEATGRP